MSNPFEFEKQLFKAGSPALHQPHPDVERQSEQSALSRHVSEAAREKKLNYETKQNGF